MSSVGIGLRDPYFEHFLTDPSSSVSWLEIHPENYFEEHIKTVQLDSIRKNYPISFHCVGMSLGSVKPSEDYIDKLQEMISRYEPFVISDHLSWCVNKTHYYKDLFPLPCIQEALDTMCENVDYMQSKLGREILIENPSTYLQFKSDGDDFSESHFLNTLAEKTGCGILLDVNNIFVQSFNHLFDPYQYLSEINWKHVKELHLAGHTRLEHVPIIVDTHDNKVCEEVWNLYKHAIELHGTIDTLVEWDDNFPPIEDLLKEAEKAKNILNAYA